jgi:hypothetical protein
MCTCIHMLRDFSTKKLRITCKASCFHRVNFEHYENNLDNHHRIQSVSATIACFIRSKEISFSIQHVKYVCLYLCLYMHMHVYIHKFCSDIYVCLTHPVCDCVCVCVWHASRTDITHGGRIVLHSLMLARCLHMYIRLVHRPHNLPDNLEEKHLS